MSHIIPDILTESGEWLKTTRINKHQYSTYSGNKWTKMRDRCLVGGYQQTKYHRYVGCYMSKDFENFQLFTGWLRSVKGYGLSNYHLDKDLLVKGNKCYGVDTCCYIPAQLNMFLVNQVSTVQNNFIGAHWHKRYGWQSNISINGSVEHLGYFETENEAHLAYVFAKESEAKRWATRLEAGEFLVEDYVISALNSWKVN